MKKKWPLLAISCLVLFVIVSIGFSAVEKKMARTAETIILTSAEIQWKEGSLTQPDSKIAILEGDPGRRGFFVMRIKVPAGTKVLSLMCTRT